MTRRSETFTDLVLFGFKLYFVRWIEDVSLSEVGLDFVGSSVMGGKELETHKVTNNGKGSQVHPNLLTSNFGLKFPLLKLVIVSGSSSELIMDV